MNVTTTQNDAIHDLLVDPLADAGYELVDVVLASGTLQVLVERNTGERIDLDGVAQATRIVDELLESADPITGSYTLEVSSPGLERPLRTPEHFRRFTGSVVSVKTAPGVEGERRIEAPLESADDDGVTIGGRRLAYDQIERARTVFVWGPAPKPTGARKGAKPPKPLQSTPRDQQLRSAPTSVPEEGEQR